MSLFHKEKLKSLCREHWLLLPIFVFGFFGVGYQTVPVFVWLFFPTVLSYSRKQWFNLLTVYIVFTIGGALANLGIFDGDTTLPTLQHPGAAIGLASVGNLNVVAALAIDRLAQRRVAWQRLTVFPCAWTGLWLFYGVWGNFGDSYTFSNALTSGWPELLQLAALLGRPSLDFVLAMFGTAVLELFTALKDTPVLIDDTPRPSSAGYRTASAYAALMVLVLAYGGFRVNIHNGSFYQVGYTNYVPKTVPVGCVVGPGGIDMPLQYDHAHWFDKSVQLARSGAKLVLWSEETAAVDDAASETRLLEQAKQVAAEHGIYLAITYDVRGPVGENKLTMITPSGDIAINYNKAHPVPGVETQPAGEEVLQYVDTPEFGRIGAAICFDYNFASYIRQASKHNVDVMLQATWTWGPIGTYHARGNAVRAIENGFTQFRCASQSLSGIFEPTSNGIFQQQVATLTNNAYLFYMPLQKRIWTVYGVTGDVFGYGCLVASLFAAVYFVLKPAQQAVQLEEEESA
ncbi:carbon-nitrogen hydrolase [Syncephalastrum racemosum]|uniref:Carbon-nitrogen hydrolase n=1 Tax=Syncephalastrum racemosum TaxID=13706 RepID=A0A1X2HE85_SYNRA|nr:carbon-nitrogen hydrolase [Syncephalastrum racemosum]